MYGWKCVQKMLLVCFEGLAKLSGRVIVWCPDPSQYKRTRKRMRERGEKGLVKNYGASRAQEFVSSGCGYNEYHYHVMNNIILS